MVFRKAFFSVLFQIFLAISFPSEFFGGSRGSLFLPSEYTLFKSCYPDLKFSERFDSKLKDWRVSVERPVSTKSQKTETREFLWADGRMIPESELKNQKKYWSLLYSYDKYLRNPEDFTEEEIARMRKFGSTESRKSQAGSPMFFFDFLYDAYSQKSIERHIVKTTFLGKSTKVHERIEEPLKRVERKINAAKGEKGVKEFLDTLASTDAYYWRFIANTDRKSFHSYGIAVDCLPKRLYGKQTYWSWAKDKFGDDWMLTPLSDRWMPPKKVVQIFEGEGFIWGGKWGIWDTMHFEYHPELIKFNGIGEE